MPSRVLQLNLSCVCACVSVRVCVGYLSCILQYQVLCARVCVECGGLRRGVDTYVCACVCVVVWVSVDRTHRKGA